MVWGVAVSGFRDLDPAWQIRSSAGKVCGCIGSDGLTPEEIWCATVIRAEICKDILGAVARVLADHNPRLGRRTCVFLTRLCYKRLYLAVDIQGSRLVAVAKLVRLRGSRQGASPRNCKQPIIIGRTGTGNIIIWGCGGADIIVGPEGRQCSRGFCWIVRICGIARLDFYIVVVLYSIPVAVDYLRICAVCINFLSVFKKVSVPIRIARIRSVHKKLPTVRETIVITVDILAGDDVDPHEHI